MSIGLRQTKSGLLVPYKKPVGVRCGFCPTIIFQRNEAKGRLFMCDGKPICAKCRILKFSRMKNAILGDKNKMLKDLEDRNKVLQEKENERVKELAAKTQKATKAGKKYK